MNIFMLDVTILIIDRIIALCYHIIQLFLVQQIFVLHMYSNLLQPYMHPNSLVSCNRIRKLPQYP